MITGVFYFKILTIINPQNIIIMLTLVITDEQLQTAFQQSLDGMLDPKNYSNPVKSVLDNILGYGGSMKGELGSQIETFLSTAMETPAFQQQLGEAIAKEMAKRAVDALEKKK